MTLSANQIVILLLSWLGYAVLHSLLAALGFKRWLLTRWPDLGPAYRLAFNVLAVVLLIPPLWLTMAWSGALLWAWSGAWAWLANALALAAVAGFVLSPLHRYVRHPWYSLGLLILWTRDMDEARLISTLCITLYLWLGSLLEERKLLAFHGEAYARYRARVAGLIPLPGHILSAQEAQALCRLPPRAD